MSTPNSDTLNQRIEKLEEQNLKLRAEMGEMERYELKIKADIANLEALITNAPNFAAYRGVVDDDFVVRDMKAAYDVNSPGHPTWRVVYTSPNFQEVTGVPDPMDPKTWFSHIHPDDQLRMLNTNDVIKVTGILDAQYRGFHTLRNEWRWFHVIAKVISDEIEKTKYSNGMIIDTTDYKRVERELLAHQKRLRALNDEVQNSEERERRRIAGILHDSIGQKLFAAKWEVERMMAAKGDSSSDSDTQALSFLDGCIAETRSLTAELFPRELYEFGLVTALKRLAADFERRFELKVAFKEVEAIEEISDELKLIMFRGVSELMNNVVKHAQAKKAVIAVEAVGKALKVSVADDGLGFDYPSEQDGESRGIGLFSVQERLYRVGGKMRVETPEKGGARVVLEVMVSDEDGDERP